RKAASVRATTSLGGWLHRVACSVAANLRRERSRRQRRERQVAPPAPRDPAAEMSWQEVRGALDDELRKLPERYRAPLVLGCLEGPTRDEAAGRLGLTPGAMRGRLERARRLLGARLRRRGLTLSAALVAAALGEGSGLAGLSPTFVLSSARAAVLFAGAEPAAGAAAPAHVLALAREVLRNMHLTRLKLHATAAALCVGLLALVRLGSVPAAALGQAAATPPPPAPPPSGTRP